MKFNIIHILFFIGVTSPGIYQFIYCIKTDEYLHIWQGNTSMKLMIIWHWINSITPFVFLIQLSFFIIIVVHYRSLRELSRPGPAAGLTAIIVFLSKITQISVQQLIFTVDNSKVITFKFVKDFFNDDFYLVFWRECYELPREIGCAVFCVWIVLRLLDRFRRESTWDNVLGYALGGFWIVIVPFSWFSAMY